jgi:hypothetical protein
MPLSQAEVELVAFTSISQENTGREVDAFCPEAVVSGGFPD